MALLTSAFVASVVSGFIPFVNAEVVVAGAPWPRHPEYTIPVIGGSSNFDLLASSSPRGSHGR